MNTAEIAYARHTEGYNCAQSVLAAYASALGLEETAAMKVSTGFGGGLGRLGSVCGAVSGAVMVLGLKYGMTAGADAQAKDRTYTLVRELAAQFKARHGVLDCRDLLGCDLNTAEGMQLARERKLFETLCPKLIISATEILDGLLARA